MKSLILMAIVGLLFCQSAVASTPAVATGLSVCLNFQPESTKFSPITEATLASAKTALGRAKVSPMGIRIELRAIGMRNPVDTAIPSKTKSLAMNRLKTIQKQFKTIIDDPSVSQIESSVLFNHSDLSIRGCESVVKLYFGNPLHRGVFCDPPGKGQCHLHCRDGSCKKTASLSSM